MQKFDLRLYQRWVSVLLPLVADAWLMHKGAVTPAKIERGSLGAGNMLSDRRLPALSFAQQDGEG